MDMEAIDAQRKDSCQCQHASHRGHVVKIGLRVLNVSVRRVRTDYNSAHRYITPFQNEKSKTVHVGLKYYFVSGMGAFKGLIKS